MNRMKITYLLYLLSLIALSLTPSFAQTSSDADFSYGRIAEPVKQSEAARQHIAFSFPITAQVIYTELSHFQTNEGRDFFRKALELESAQEKIEVELQRLRQEYAANAHSSNQKYIGDEILHQENESYATAEQIKELQGKANELECAHWAKASAEERAAFAAHFSPKTKIYAKASDYINNNPLNTASNYKRPSRQVELAAAQEAADNQLAYKIEVGRYKVTPRSIQNKFKKLGFIRRIEQQRLESGETLYTVGELGNYADAQRMQKQLENEGFSRTKIIAFQGANEVKIDESGSPLSSDEMN